MIDLRSDTVTKPTKEMKLAMLNAKLGDDVFEDDPTVKAFELLTAKTFGKQAGLFCPSGTMSNQMALMVHLKPGDEVIMPSYTFSSTANPVVLKGAKPVFADINEI